MGSSFSSKGDAVSITLPTADSQREAEIDAPPLRFVTAASLFDGHDAAINVMRRLIQDRGAEVIHLGHNRSVGDIVRAAIQEDADAIAISSYQGGHIEFFRYAVEMLRERGAGHILVFGGGGGTITEAEIAELEGLGVTRLYHPNDGMKLGLTGMIDDLVARATERRVYAEPITTDARDDLSIAQMLSALEDGVLDDDTLERLRDEWSSALRQAPVVGITGTGGAGKSTVTDELLSRFAQHFPGGPDRCGRRRSDPTAYGRGAARRSDPHEQPAQRADLHALDGDAAAQPLDQRDAGGRRRISALQRVRPRAGRDRRYRPERL